MQFYKQRILLFLLAGLLVQTGLSESAHATSTLRDGLVGILVYRLANHVRWADATSIDSYGIHVIDDNSNVAEQLENISASKRLNGKSFSVSRSAEIEVPPNTHVVYLAKDKSARFPEVMDKVKGHNILLISDNVKNDRIVMLNLIDLGENKLGFTMNKANMINQNLGVAPDIVLLGGTEVDVARLYREGQVKLAQTRARLHLLQTEVRELAEEKHALKTDLATRQREFKAQSEKLDQTRRAASELRDKTKQQQGKLAQLTAQLDKTNALLTNQEKILQSQRETIDRHQSAIKQQQIRLEQLENASRLKEQDIRQQSEALDRRRKHLDKQQKEIDVRRAILEKQQAQIKGQTLHINEQASVIKRQRNKIRDQDSVLSERGAVIESQKKYLLLLSFSMALTTIFAFVAYRNFRSNKRAAIELLDQRDLLERTAQQLKHAKDQAESASRAKSTFLANMSHELRTPLNAVLGFSELMARDAAISSQHRANIDVINRSGKLLLSMINDVLDISKIEAGKVELNQATLDLEQALTDISDLISLRSKEKNLAFELELDPELPKFIRLDANKLRQVLINLLSNALKFTPKGKITLTARMQPMADKPGIQFIIEDTGIGIEKDKLNAIFEPFTQVERRSSDLHGTGLGLAISRQFVQLMGGDITVTSEPGKGARFEFVLPLVAVETPNVHHLEQPRQVAGIDINDPQWRILVVEDQSENRLLLKKVLTLAGFTVYEAANGAEAITQFDKFHPHLVWMDLRMPVMDGYKAAKKIRQREGGDKVKIIALTANAVKGQRDAALSAGCDDVVYKPFKVNEILERMAQHLNIHYIYEKRHKALQQPQGLTAGDLAGLPAGLINELIIAARKLDHTYFYTLLETDDVNMRAVREGLHELADKFRFDLILSLLQEAQSFKEKAV